MRRREDRAISKHTLNLYAGDYEKIQAWAGMRIGAAKVIRDLVHAHVRKIEDEAAQQVNLVGDLEIDLQGMEAGE